MNTVVSMAPITAQTPTFKFFTEILKRFGSECWIAGGAPLWALTNLWQLSDVDVFFQRQDDIESAQNTLAKMGFYVDFESSLAVRMKHPDGWEKGYAPIHLVKRKTYITPSSILEDFDFTIVCLALDRTGRLIYHPDTFYHIHTKQLEIAETVTDPAGTLRRLPKYVSRGFTPTASCIASIAMALRDQDWEFKSFYDDDSNRGATDV